ncbi:MAG: hypothetical protein Q9211_000915, partial [Gyalolechia sp. 1 TL-2023]
LEGGTDITRVFELASRCLGTVCLHVGSVIVAIKSVLATMDNPLTGIVHADGHIMAEASSNKIRLKGNLTAEEVRMPLDHYLVCTVSPPSETFSRQR